MHAGMHQLEELAKDVSLPIYWIILENYWIYLVTSKTFALWRWLPIVICAVISFLTRKRDIIITEICTVNDYLKFFDYSLYSSWSLAMRSFWSNANHFPCLYPYLHRAKTTWKILVAAVHACIFSKKWFLSVIAPQWMPLVICTWNRWYRQFCFHWKENTK